jgi:uncharacterized phiE125 gp8 family phage protein
MHDMALNANALVTLALAKKFLKIPALDITQDDMVELFINAASDLFEAETDRKLKFQNHTEIFDGKKTNIILLGEWPVTAIASVQTDPSGKFDGSETTVDSTTYGIGDGGNSLVSSVYLPSGFRNIKVAYSAGYSIVPADIQNSVCWIVSYYYQMRDNKDIGRTSKGKGDESTQILQELPPDVKQTISRYARMEVGTSRMARYG